MAANFNFFKSIKMSVNSTLEFLMLVGKLKVFLFTFHNRKSAFLDVNHDCVVKVLVSTLNNFSTLN